MRYPARAVGTVLTRVPSTLAYSTAVLGTSLWLSQADATTRAQVIHQASTNLVNLRDGQWSVLFTSAVVVAHPLAPRLLVSAALLAAGELWLGRLRAPTVFLLGHVGASLAVYGMLEADVLPGVRAGAVAAATDVGTSYGTLAVLGAVAAARVPLRAVPWSAALLAVVASGVVVGDADFTDWGHLLAAGIGVSAGGVLAARRGRVSPAPAGGAVEA